MKMTVETTTLTMNSIPCVIENKLQYLRIISMLFLTHHLKTNITASKKVSGILNTIVPCAHKIVSWFLEEALVIVWGPAEMGVQISYCLCPYQYAILNAKFVSIIITNGWFWAPPKARTMTHYTVQFNNAIPELGTVGSLEQERFQGTLENRRGTHQLEFCWQAVPCTGGGNRKRPLDEFQTGPGNDVVAVWRIAVTACFYIGLRCFQGHREFMFRNWKISPPVPKFPKIPVPEILQNKPQSNFQKCRIPPVLKVFRGLHSAGIQAATDFIIEQIINEQKSVL